MGEVIALMSGFGACDCPEVEVLLDSWLLNEIEEAGLDDEYLYAARAANGDGILKFLNRNGLADKGGYHDVRIRKNKT